MTDVDDRRVGRRAVLRGGLAGAGLVLVPGALAAVAAGCSQEEPSLEVEPLLSLGRSLSRSADGARLAKALPPGVDRPPADEAGVLAAVATAAPSIEQDLRDGRVVLGRGWLLAESEAAILVAYARR